MNQMDDFFLSYTHKEQLNMRDYRSMLLDMKNIDDPIIDSDHKYANDFFGIPDDVFKEQENLYNRIVIDYINVFTINLPNNLSYNKFHDDFVKFIKYIKVFNDNFNFVSIYTE
jgi:hypothetical protein